MKKAIKYISIFLLFLTIIVFFLHITGNKNIKKVRTDKKLFNVLS